MNYDEINRKNSYDGNLNFSGKLMVDISGQPSLVFDNLDELNEAQKRSYCENIDNIGRGDAIVFDKGIEPQSNTIYNCEICYEFSGDGEDFEDYFLVTNITPITCLPRDY